MKLINFVRDSKELINRRVSYVQKQASEENVEKNFLLKLNIIVKENS